MTPPMRRTPLLIALAALLVGMLAITATVDAKKKKPPFKTGKFAGTLISKPAGVPPTEKPIRVSVYKSYGGRYQVDPGLSLNQRYATLVTCPSGIRPYPMVFQSIYASKKTGKFSGKTLPQYPGGRIKGKVKGKRISGTWSFSGPFDAAPDAETCTGSGTFTAKRYAPSPFYSANSVLYRRRRERPRRHPRRSLHPVRGLRPPGLAGRGGHGRRRARYPRGRDGRPLRSSDHLRPPGRGGPRPAGARRRRVPRRPPDDRAPRALGRRVRLGGRRLDHDPPRGHRRT